MPVCLCEQHEPRTDRGKQVDWSPFANGRWWQIRRGDDHDQTPRKALQAARMWAKRAERPMLVEAVLPPVGQDDTPWKIRFTYREARG